MKSPREYYKEQHPNEFSDSRVEEVTDYDREVIDFALSSITTNNQEQAFEKFSLRVCEVRVCANLIPNTGPAGGGDGKVDADTFPVSDSLDEKYYEGIGRQLTNERWAFAFSAKQAWKQKLQSDIKSILSTKRPYGQIIFVTNQSIPSKDRQSVQDDLSAQHGIPVTILDRTWLLDSIVYHNCARFAIEELGFNSAQKFNILTSPRDQRKRDRLNELLAQIKDDSENNPSFLSVENALLAAKIARTLEEPQPKVELLFQEARTHALSRGTDAQRMEVEYQLAWTRFWWYEDFNGFIESYNAFIESLTDAPSFDELSKWRNLWNLVPVARRETNGDVEDRRTEDLVNAIDSKISASTPGSTSELNLHVLKLELSALIQLSQGEVPRDTFGELARLLPQADHHLGFDFEGFVKWIEVVASMVPADPQFEELYDLTTDIHARREGEVSAARLQLERAESLIESGSPKEAVTRLSRAHSHLLKNETRSECIYCLFLLGSMYLRLGLVWAARAAFISTAAISLNYLNTDDKLHPGLRGSFAHLRLCSTALGLIGESLGWHELTRLMLGLTYARTGEDRTIPDEESRFEILLGRLILRIPSGSRTGLESLPAVLDKLDMPINADLARVKLGADLSIADYLPKPPTGSALDSIFHMKAEIDLPEKPVDVPSDPTTLSTTLFGSQFILSFDDWEKSGHLAELLLSLIEPIFATATMGQVFALQETVKVRISSTAKAEQGIVTTRLESDPTVDFLVEHDSDVSDLLWREPEVLAHKLVECALLVGFGSFMSQAILSDLESNKDRSLFDRAHSVCRLIADLKFVVGEFDCLRLKPRLAGEEETFVITSEKWAPTATSSAAERVTTREPEPIRSDAVFQKALSELSHSDITVVSPIRGALWDAAHWFGVLFAWSPYEQTLPLMALGFDNEESGNAILEGWRSAYGSDVSERIRITIIRGISRENPHHYRVVISGQVPDKEANSTRFVQSIGRVHTMQPTSSVNLDSFLAMFEFHGKYILSVAGRNCESQDAINDVISKGIVMTGINVRQAWEIGRHDLDIAGIQPEDDVVIPEGINNPPISELQEWKRDLEKKRDGRNKKAD